MELNEIYMQLLHYVDGFNLRAHLCLKPVRVFPALGRRIDATYRQQGPMPRVIHNIRVIGGVGYRQASRHR